MLGSIFLMQKRKKMFSFKYFWKTLGSIFVMQKRKKFSFKYFWKMLGSISVMQKKKVFIENFLRVEVGEDTKESGPSVTLTTASLQTQSTVCLAQPSWEAGGPSE